MGNNPRFRRGPYDDILLKVLRGNSLSRKELRELTKQKESPNYIPSSTLDRRLKQLEKYGIIKHVPDQYKIVEEVPEADPEQIKECIDVIQNKDENEMVLHNRIMQLRMISYNKRIAHLPNVLLTLEECLKSPKIINNEETFQELNYTLKNILRFEEKHRLPESDKIIERITTGILNKILDEINRQPSFPEKHLMEFIISSKKIEAVEVLFHKIRVIKPNYSQIDKLSHALREVYSIHFKTINKHIDNLSRSDDEDLQKIGSQMRPYLI